jgi:hypothetical protein
MRNSPSTCHSCAIRHKGQPPTSRSRDSLVHQVSLIPLPGILIQCPSLARNEKMGHSSSSKENTKAQGRGLPPDGVRSRPHWVPPCAHEKGRVGRLLVVRLRKKTIVRSPVGWMPGVKARVEKITGKKRKRGQRRSERGARLKVVDLFRDERLTEAVLEFLARSLQRCRRSRRLSDAVRTSVEARLCEVNSPPPATFIWSIRRDMNLQILREDEQYASHVKHPVQYPHLSFSFTFYLLGLSLDVLERLFRNTVAPPLKAHITRKWRSVHTIRNGWEGDVNGYRGKLLDVGDHFH